MAKTKGTKEVSPLDEVTMVKKRVRSWTNKDKSQSFETNELNSMCIPQQSLTIREIMANHTEGIPPPMRDPLYQYVDLESVQEGFLNTDFSKMDKVDRLVLAKKVEQKIKELKEEASTRQELIDKKKADAEFNAAVAKKVEEAAKQGEKAPEGPKTAAKGT